MWFDEEGADNLLLLINFTGINKVGYQGLLNPRIICLKENRASIVVE
tara:strand:+ start:65905 stop:66045 length:141 start_codon:yes stop_codon:yes gene_type:complete